MLFFYPSTIHYFKSSILSYVVVSEKGTEVSLGQSFLQFMETEMGQLSPGRIHELLDNKC